MNTQSKTGKIFQSQATIFRGKMRLEREAWKKELYQSRLRFKTEFLEACRDGAQDRINYIKALKSQVDQLREEFQAARQVRRKDLIQLKNDTLQQLIDFVEQHRDRSLQGHKERKLSIQAIQKRVKELIQSNKKT
ncbi:MAG: hypothetical protein AAFU64_11185 [Bacteroidota bacterium]